MPLRYLNPKSTDEFLDEPNQPHYTIADVVKVVPAAGVSAPFDVMTHFYVVCYGELCAYPNEDETGPGWCWDDSDQEWDPIP